jgi:putative nucleotidyltransferase with HDIG domain
VINHHTLNYKKELETAAKSMILIRDPRVLIKMIVRMIVRKVGVVHTGILLYDKEKDTYVLTVSQGVAGLKVPAGFARTDCDNALIRFFREEYDKKIFGQRILETRRLQRELASNTHRRDTLNLLKNVSYQMEIFEATACVPSFYRDPDSSKDELMGLLLLGEKQDNRRFKQDELDFFAALASDVAMALRNAQLFKELQAELERRRKLFFHTTTAMAAAIEAKDNYTHGHIQRVINYSLAIGEILMKQKKLDGAFMENLRLASLLHDIGKIGTPERLLNKPSGLTIGERKIIQKHPSDGVTILQSIRELHDIIPGVKHHHERYDGKGYPEGLKGKQIPLIAAIIAVADAFDAMTTDRPYRKALTQEAAIAELVRGSATQFYPLVVKAAITALTDKH